MTDRPGLDLGALLADPARAADVPADAIAAVLTEVTAQEARLGTVKAILAARLAGASNGHPRPRRRPHRSRSKRPPNATVSRSAPCGGSRAPAASRRPASDATAWFAPLIL